MQLQSSLLLLAATALAVQGKHDHSPCPESFDQVGSHCFHLNTYPRTWMDAYSYCKSLGAMQVNLETANKHELFAAYLLRKASFLKYENYIGFTHEHFWLGGVYVYGHPSHVGQHAKGWFWQYPGGVTRKITYWQSTTDHSSGGEVFKALYMYVGGNWIQRSASKFFGSACQKQELE